MLRSDILLSLLKRALIGSHKGNCHIYDTSGTSPPASYHHVFSSAMTYLFFYFFWTDNKLLQKKQIDLQNKKKKSSQKKITGFQVHSPNKFAYTSQDVYTVIFFYRYKLPVLLNNSSLNSFSQGVLQRSLLHLLIQESGLLMALI